MPMSVNKTSGGDSYPSPFVGLVSHTVAIDVDLSDLSTFEVDTHGRIKPGVPLTKSGQLVASPQTKSTVAQGTVTTGNANGVIGAATGGYGQPAETITATLLTTGATAHAAVEGSKSGYIGELIVGTAFVSPQLNVTVSDGATDFEAGDVITWDVTAGDNDEVYGVTVEAQKLVDNNVAALTGVFAIVVATDGLVNRDLAEDILGRAYTAAEIAGFRAGIAVTNS
jgi:hypothetical protein